MLPADCPIVSFQPRMSHLDVAAKNPGPASAGDRCVGRDRSHFRAFGPSRPHRRIHGPIPARSVRGRGGGDHARSALCDPGRLALVERHEATLAHDASSLLPVVVGRRPWGSQPGRKLQEIALRSGRPLRASGRLLYQIPRSPQRFDSRSPWGDGLATSFADVEP